MATDAGHSDEVSGQRFAGLFPALLLVNFTSAIGFSIVLPFLVFLVHQWGGNSLIFGLVGATYSVFQLFGSIVLGRWSDRFGRKRILLLSQLGTSAAWLIVLVAFFVPVSMAWSVDSSVLGKFSLSLPLLLLFLSRALDGLTAGSVSVVNAYVGDITPKEQRDERFGKLGVSSSLGSIVGPAVAGMLGGIAFGYEWLVIFAIGVSILAIMTIFFRLPDVKPRAPRVDPHAHHATKVLGQEPRSCIQPQVFLKVSSAAILQLPGVGIMMMAYFLIMLAFNFFYIAFPLQAASEMRWSVAHTGGFFALMSFFMVVVQGVLLPYLSRTWTDRRLVCTGAIVLGCGFFLLLLAKDWLAFFAAVLIAVGNGLLWPPLVALLSKAAGKNQGVVQGLAGSVGAAAGIIGLLMGGVLYAYVTDWLFVLSAVLTLLVVVLSMWFPQQTAAH